MMALNEGTAESRTLQECYTTLVEAIQDPDTLTSVLFSKGILSQEIVLELYDPQLSRAQKNHKILQCVQSRVVSDPSSLWTFVSSLQCVPSAQYLANILVDTFRYKILTTSCESTCATSIASTPTEAQPAVKRIRLDDSQVQTQGDAYHNYCSNVCAVYQRAPLQKKDCWPPMQKVEYTNLAILKSDKLTFSDDYTLMTIQRSADDIVSKKKRVGFNELFDRLDSGVRILVEGRPGCGKTTLMNKVSLDWANKIILKDIALLLLVPLRRFHKKQEVKLDDILRFFKGFMSNCFNLVSCPAHARLLARNGLEYGRRARSLRLQYSRDPSPGRVNSFPDQNMAN